MEGIDLNIQSEGGHINKGYVLHQSKVNLLYHDHHCCHCM